MSTRALQQLIRRPSGVLIFSFALALAGSASAQIQVGLNGYYDVAVASDGAYTVRTGQLHPVPLANVFYGGSTLAPWSSWNTVRSYRSNIEWLLGGGGLPPPDAGFTSGSINEYSRSWITPLLDGGGRQTGARIDWAFDTFANGSVVDELHITQEVNAEGSTLENSRVRVTICIENRDSVEAEVGVRYLWDWQLGTQDGAYMGIRPPGPPVEPYLAVEQDFPNPTWDSYDVSTERRPSSTPSVISVGGSVNRPTPAIPPTPPELVQYAGWPGAANTCFDYATTGQPVGTSDSAVAYYWGATRATPIRIAPGETWCATQYVVAPPRCGQTPIVRGGTSCGTPVALDASASVSSSCTGQLEYRFTDPRGVVTQNWSTNPFATANDTGTWTLDVRCSTDPGCTAADWAEVRIDRVPALSAGGTLITPCDLGVSLSWSALFNGPSASGVVNVYRSEIDCADALTRAPIVAGSLALGHDDLTTAAGATYWYVVEAEDAAALSPCVPQGAFAGGAATRVCLGPFSDTFDTVAPSRMCWPLRLSHAMDDVTLDWAGARALVAGEHFHVLKAWLDSRDPFVLMNAEGDVARTYTENDTTAWLQFFDVRITNDCEVESDDDEPPHIDGPILTCP